MIARKPDETRRGLLNDADRHGTPPMSSGKRGSLVGTLNKVLDGDENRHRVLAWIFNPEAGLLSTKGLTNGEWHALWKWVAYYEDDDGWHTSPEFKTESKMILKLLDKEKAKWNQELEKLLRTPL